VPINRDQQFGNEVMTAEVVKRILLADVYAVAQETPMQPAQFLSERLGQQVLIKREDLQSVFSFKIRGAFNRIRQLTEIEKSQGVVAASAGNHAQGVALAAKHLGLRAVIVMPKTTPDIKVNSVKARDAEVRLVGDTFDEAFAYSQALVAKEGLTYIHPYDDPEVIAGQGSVGVEMMRQSGNDLDAIFLPVGGGGLIAGVATYVKYLKPGIKIIGVESTESASLAAALAARARVTLPQVGIFADGVAVAQIGEHTWELCKDRVDEVIQVSPDEICAAVKDLFVETRAIAEPSGALALAGLKKYAQRPGMQPGQRLAAVLSGANVNFDRLRYIAEVAEIGEGREVILAVTIDETPAALDVFVS
jgi:threonine dehydratase